MDIACRVCFAPNAFDADAQLAPYLQWQRRGFNQPASGEDYKMTSVVLMQQINPLMQILHPNTLMRVTNTRLYGSTYSVADIMNDLTKAIFDADLNGNVNVYRQNLQTTFVEGTISPARWFSDDISKSAARATLKNKGQTGNNRFYQRRDQGAPRQPALPDRRGNNY